MCTVNSLAVIFFGAAGVGVETVGIGCEVVVFPFFLRTILTEMSPFSASEAQSFFHELSFLLVRHGFVDFHGDVNVHRVIVSFLAKTPPWPSLFLLQSVSLDDPLNLVVVIVDLERLLIPLG